jgi:hypothetical protein
MIYSKFAHAAQAKVDDHNVFKRQTSAAGFKNIAQNTTLPFEHNPISGLQRDKSLCPPEAKPQNPAKPNPYRNTPVFTKAPCTATIGLNNWLTNWISLLG